jgi:hypothetical protein
MSELYNHIKLGNGDDLTFLEGRHTIDMMYEKGYVPYFYNNSYGGPGISELGKKLQNRIHAKYPNQTSDDGRIYRAKLIMYLQNEIKTPYSFLVFNFVLKTHIDAIVVHEYDGLERLTFDENIYIVSKFKKILKGNGDNAQKIKELTELESENITGEFKVIIDRRKLTNILSEEEIAEGNMNYNYK